MTTKQAVVFAKAIFPVFIYLGSLGILIKFAILFLIVIMVYSIIKNWHVEEMRPAIYYILFAAVMTVLSGQVDVRKYVPYMPLYYILFINSFTSKKLTFSAKFSKIILIFLFSWGCLITLFNVTRPINDVPFFKVQPRIPKQTLQWIKKNTQPSDIIASETAAVALYTGRKVVEVPWKERPDFITSGLAKNDASYILLKPNTYSKTIYKEPDVKFKKQSVHMMTYSPLFKEVYSNNMEETMILEWSAQHSLKNFSLAWKFAQAGIRAYINNDRERARTFFSRAVDLDNRLYTARLLLARIYIDAENFKMVPQYIDEAIYIWPTHPDAYFLKAEYYEKIGDEENARRFNESGMNFSSKIRTLRKEQRLAGKKNIKRN